MGPCTGRILITLAALGGAQCAHRVELYCDATKPCTDPARPFCDAQGEFPASEGIRNTCIPDPNAVADAGADAGFGEPNVVFVTSTTHTGNLGGLAGADAICQQRAEAAGLEGTFVAWLSTSEVDARARLGNARGWVRTDGEPFADTVEDMLAGRIFHPAERDELGNRATLTDATWTGTRADGSFDSSTGDCGLWNENTMSLSAMVGATFGGFEAFTAYETLRCDDKSHLLCFGTDRAARVEPEVATGRLAFVTRGRLSGRAGVAAFDALCNEEAVAAKLTGTFVAAVSIGEDAATTRLTLDGPTWVRADGIKLFDSVGDISQQATLRVPIQYTADGIDPVNTEVWTGGVDFNLANGPNCDSWTPGSNEDGVFGRSASLEAVAFDVDSCAATHPVYCFQQ